jgi:hypothetical protein
MALIQSMATATREKTMQINQDRSSRKNRIDVIAVCAVFALLAGHTQLCFGQQASTKTFSSAEEAIRSLFLAVKENNTDAITGIVGVEKDLVSVDNENQNQRERAQFIEKYQQMHRLVRETDGTVVLYLGAENWPFPVPLVSRNGTWHFDADAGAEEILSRRIGENEDAVIQACQLLALAEERYKATLHPDDPESHYTSRFISSQGAQDGLYSGAESPIPDFLANAGVSDGSTQDTTRAPYAGYYFRILVQQGKDARGGPQNYIVDGRLTAGFAFAAYPAEYGTSGIMTFIVNQDNIVYQKDLGPETRKIVEAMTRYNPGPGWRRPE